MSGIPAGAGSLLGKRLGKYEILALLALGGTAEIYLARIGGTAGFEKYVVVKCLHDHLADDEDFVKMFLDEARLAAILDHSNIVQTFELGEHEDRYYMVMEFLAGLSLAMVVRRASERLPDGKVSVQLILNIAAQACAGLHYAHERTANGKPLNMVHRDISPQNLVISFEGVVKVVDFGIARAEMRETKTKAGTIKGKFAYMSPEQCIAADVDRRTDIFALGVIVHELLTGRRLFKRNSAYETYQAVMECVVDPPSFVNHELDPALDELIMRALAKAKEDRYPTAEAFGDAMLGYLHHRGKNSGPAELGRFFDQYFSQEIDEHGDRMRELISGRDFSVDTGVNWGTEEEEAAKRAQETVDLAAKQERASREGGSIDELESADIEVVRSSEASLGQMVSRLGTSNGAGDEPQDESDGPVDRTRIEQNPLEALDALDREVRRAPVPMGSVTGGPAPLPAPPTVALGAPTPTIGGKVSGRFPDLANLPTQMAAGDRPAPEHAETELGAKIVDPRLAQTMAQLPPQPQVSRTSAQSAIQEAARLSQLQQAVQPPGGSMYPVVQGGRPYNSDLAPSNPPSQQARPSFPNQPAVAPPPQTSDPQHAANVMSPVGEHYPQAVDWDAAAAQPAKAIPPWVLGVFFVGALTVALLLTIVIAKIIH